jgi:pimeloyl-ACP methyl ester carboxylesterase
VLKKSFSSMYEMAHNLRAGTIEQCGHPPHEEQPDQVKRPPAGILDRLTRMI